MSPRWYTSAITGLPIATTAPGPPAVVPQGVADDASVLLRRVGEANALAMDFNGITVDDRSDADDAILRDRTQYDARSEQQAKGFSAA